MAKAKATAVSPAGAATGGEAKDAFAAIGGDAVKQSRTGIVSIPGVNLETVRVLIIGTAPLIAHKFSEKAKNMILAKHTGQAVEGRKRKDPVANFNGARYRLSDGSDGIPSGGVKAALVEGFGKDVGVFVSKAKGAIRVKPDDIATNLCRIITPFEPIMREDVVRNETGVVDIRHRPEYWPWGMFLEITFLPTIIARDQLLQAIARSGFTQGLCEWRPGSPKSKSGSFGTWRFSTEEEIEAFENGRLFADATPRTKPTAAAGLVEEELVTGEEVEVAEAAE